MDHPYPALVVPVSLARAASALQFKPLEAWDLALALVAAAAFLPHPEPARLEVLGLLAS